MNTERPHLTLLKASTLHLAMAANAAASGSISQEEYEKELQEKNTTSLFSDSTVRSDLAQNFKGIASSDGKELEGDVIEMGVGVADVLPKFRGMIKERFEADKEKGLSDARKWLFKAVPLYLCPGKSLDDFYTGYLLWSQKVCSCERRVDFRVEA